MKRPTTLISKLKHCYNGEFQDVCDYIIFLENLTKTQRVKTIETIENEPRIKAYQKIYDICDDMILDAQWYDVLSVQKFNEIKSIVFDTEEQMKEQ